MQLHEFQSTVGSKQSSKRRGRGNGSGRGTFSGRGCKGQNARAGGGVRPGFEGGQTPLYRRLPKLKGFNNIHKVSYQPVNVSDFSRIEGNIVSLESLYQAGLISKLTLPVKVLASGDVQGAYTVTVHKISASAQEKIEKAGGSVNIL